MGIKSKTLQRQLSHRDILQLFLNEWRLFAGLSALLASLGFGFFLYTRAQVGTARIIINDSQNNTQQALAQSVSGVAKSIIEGRRGNSILLKQLEHLKSYAFFEKVVSQLMRSSSAELTSVKGQLQLLLKDTADYQKDLVSLLRNKTFFTVENDFMFKVNVRWETSQEAHVLTDFISRLAKEELTSKESNETLELLEILKSQKKMALETISELRSSLKEKNIDADLMLAAGSSTKIGDYLTDLKIRAQETRLQIEENDSLIAQFKGSSKGINSYGMVYGIGGKIRSLQDDNKILKVKLSSLEKTIKQWTQMNEQLPGQVMELDDIKNQASTEKQKIEDLSQAINKIEVQKSSAMNRYQLLEPSRLELVKSRFSLWMIFGFSLFLAQILGSLWLYLRHLLSIEAEEERKDRYVHGFTEAEATADYFIQDSRFTVEDGKLRFKADSLLDGGRKLLGRMSSHK